MYEPTIWQDGDLITAERLNKLEQGVANEQGSAGPGVTLEEVNAIVQAAVLDSWEGLY